MPATAPAAEDDLAPVRLADLQLALARKTSPRVKLDLYAPPSPPLVVADGCGLLVQRRFGR